MTPEQIKLIKETWDQVKPISDQAAELFYNRLFELDPELKPLFKTDIKSQGEKLMTMITTAVDNLDNLDKIIFAVQDLGKRHADYGVKAGHYETVGSALLWTLEQGLGDGYTDEVKEAWTITYGTLADVMLEAAAETA